MYNQVPNKYSDHRIYIETCTNTQSCADGKTKNYIILYNQTLKGNVPNFVVHRFPRTTIIIKLCSELPSK